jgi:hypothetical protein
MSRNTWLLAKRVGLIWEDEDPIYRPNANLKLSRQATLTKTALANGSFGYVSPEVKSNHESLKITWFYLPKADHDRIEDYVSDGDDLRITDHNNDIYYGRFITIDTDWLAGEEDRCDIVAAFEIIPSLEN